MDNVTHTLVFMERPADSDAGCCLNGPFLCGSHTEAVLEVLKYVTGRFVADVDNFLEVIECIKNEEQVQQLTAAVGTYSEALLSAEAPLATSHFANNLSTILGENVEQLVRLYFNQANDDDCMEAWYSISEVA